MEKTQNVCDNYKIKIKNDNKRLNKIFEKNISDEISLYCYFYDTKIDLILNQMKITFNKDNRYLMILAAKFTPKEKLKDFKESEIKQFVSLFKDDFEKLF